MPAKKKNTETTENDRPYEQLSYEQAYAQLEETVAKMSAASVPLEELLALYERGMELGEHCEKLLKNYEARLERVSAKSIMRELEPADEAQDDEPPFEADDDENDF